MKIRTRFVFIGTATLAGALLLACGSQDDEATPVAGHAGSSGSAAGGNGGSGGNAGTDGTSGNGGNAGEAVKTALSCAADGEGCSCQMAASKNVAACDNTASKGLTCCSSGAESDGSYACSCERRPMTDWQCWRSAWSCVCQSASRGSPGSGFTKASSCEGTAGQTCGYLAISNFCECKASNVSGQPLPKDVVANCTTPPTSASGACPSGTTTVHDCSKLPSERNCSPATCSGTVSVGGYFCHSSCQNNECVEDCNF